MNCHPKKSAHIVREVIDKLRSGEQSKAEFWINKPGLFLYIVYVAVRDEQGHFRGVLEMMQRLHSYSCNGRQSNPLTWANEAPKEEVKEEEHDSEEQTVADGAEIAIDGDTKLKTLLKTISFLKEEIN